MVILVQSAMILNSFDLYQHYHDMSEWQCRISTYDIRLLFIAYSMW